MKGTNKTCVIKFSEMWNKLVCRAVGDELHTVRWIDKKGYYESGIGNECILYIHSKPIYKCIITEVIEARLGDISDAFIQADTFPEYNRMKFYEIMYNWYHKKPEWDGWNSKICIVFLKITEHLEASSRIDECDNCKTVAPPKGGSLLEPAFGTRCFECPKCHKAWIIGTDDNIKRLSNVVIYGDSNGRVAPPEDGET